MTSGQFIRVCALVLTPGFLHANEGLHPDETPSVQITIGRNKPGLISLAARQAPLAGVLEEISASLARGDSVKLSSFGSVLVRDKGQRVGRNPKTGVEVPIEPRRVMVFKPSNIMKARVNGEAVPDSD